MRDQGSVLKGLVVAMSVMTALVSSAFQPIPKDSAKALGVTRGKAFSSGAVFVNGKYIEPPYVVERWGTGIRINKEPVTGQVIDWNEFLKTQEGVKVEKKTEAVPSAPVVQKATAEVEDADSSSLDDLFDDDPKPTKRKNASLTRSSSETRPSVSRTTVSYALDGEFKPNDASKALVGRINETRTELDRILRAGGFICFGDAYSRVTGDKRTLMAMLERLPELEQRSESLDDFRAGVRSAGLVYLNEVLCEDLFRNRIDYRRLKERRERIRSDQKWNQILDEASDPVF